MKKLLVLIIAALMAVFSVSVSAAEGEWAIGEVLYHQDFADIGEFKNSGIKLGTLSSTSAEYGCQGEYFAVQTKDSGRVYMILPQVEHGSTYTVEFTLKFTDTSNPRGYIGFMLTCRGEEPTNITSLVFRSDGTIDDFGEIPGALSEGIAAGAEIKVIIPVENNILRHIIIESGMSAYTIERDSMLVIGEGGMGLQYRQIGATVREIYIVNGVGYTEKTGELADSSYATDDKPVILPDDGEESGGAPVTGEWNFIISLGLAVISGTALMVLGVDSVRRRRQR
ncbi:MAG: hypothetical protein E7628_08305 [Ruminococcaceae bacterium]|nr:hypothetical protein [Oscillospiraceae bacterium]